MSAPSSPPEETVLVFDRDEELFAYPSLTHVTNDLEAMDVEDAEYPAVYLPDGRVLELSAPDGYEGPVLLHRTGRTDLAGLERRTARYWARYGQRYWPGAAPLGPEEMARLLLAPEERSGGGVSRRLLRWLLRRP
ncbi:hypothetical protein IQ63_37295 [Streptomyces acidiscabies]|uniref:Uncharacterized protein n=1 Tax=Streptomyces acidiscabies TaxID=42234 RepID=A0A0L0JKX0_9ACTN|nr:hypothetical protein IQ63_37295 [Streptomyces acidiscabies]